MNAINLEKTISVNSHGILIVYGDAKKHQYIKYEKQTCTKKIQEEGNTKYQKLENYDFPKFTLNDKQQTLYLEVMKGFKAFSSDDLKKMSKLKKTTIIINYTKTQRILKRYKQTVLFEELDDMLSSLFPKSPIIKQLVETKGFIDDIPKKKEISFKELGISKKDIINKLIEYNILPKNFYSIV